MQANEYSISCETPRGETARGRQAKPRFWVDGWDADLGRAQTLANAVTPVARWWAGGGVIPMFVLQAEFDTTAPAEDSSQVLLADFPDRVEVVTITNAGHAMLPEQPDRVAAAVLDFLAR